MPEARAYDPRDTLFLWWLGVPAQPRLVGELRLVSGGRAVALQYGADWLATGFPLSEDLPLTPGLFVPRARTRLRARSMTRAPIAGANA